MTIFHNRTSKFSYNVIRKFRFSNILSNTLVSFGCFVPVFILPFHIYILYKFWHDYGREVDKILCSCSCWDTVFKGSYESGVASYKHVYFNATENAMKMWVLTIIFILVLYECMKTLIYLGINCNLRLSMCILMLTSIFPHYYSWWSYINYYNDDYYKQWYHQLFFSITELFSTCMVLHLCDKKNTLTIPKLGFIMSIALVHVFASGFDQFIANVIQGEGYMHQVIRDLGFMIPDLLHIILPSSEIFKLRSRQFSSAPMSLCSTSDSTLNGNRLKGKFNVIINISVILGIGISVLCLV